MPGAEEHGGILFAEPLILLAAAVIAVPLFRAIGLGSILGYLAAGVVIGPVARIVTGGEAILHVAELGVVMLLFIVGLELRPARLWAMRSDIFGLGLAQLVLTGIALTALLSLAGYRFTPAIIIGFGLAMSSTAFGIQILTERNELRTPYGRKAFSILLFQDIAIVPLLAVVPFLSPSQAGAAAPELPDLMVVAGAVSALVLAGRYLLNPMFRLLARARAREVMTAAALLVVLGSATLMEVAGMSMAMGAFIAGVLLADSSFRHELEANIEPFRNLLLGLFFIAIGMSINVDTVLYSWWRILLAVPAIMVVKAAILYGLNRLFGAGHDDATRAALLLPQAGEFAFVLFASAGAVRALWPSEISLVAAIVTFSMAFTPASVWLAQYLTRREEPEALEEDFEGAGGEVLLIGFGRFGQIVSQVLLARGVNVTIIDNDPERVRQAARFGFRIYFGDGTRRDVLRSAGAEHAAIVCVCSGKPHVTNAIIDLARREFPGARLFARSYDRGHTIELIEKGVAYEIRETYESALLFGSETLRSLGVAAEDAEAVIQDVRRRDSERLEIQRTGGRPAGRDMMHPPKLEPEPLVQPHRHGADGEAASEREADDSQAPPRPPEKTAAR